MSDQGTPDRHADEHPIRLRVDDDLGRSRLTVLFRLLLAIPHFVWLFLWTVGSFFVAIVQWGATLVTGRPIDGLHRFLASYVRYSTHVQAYLLLAANPFPGFLGEPNSYPVDVEVDRPARQSRWKTAFRLLLAIPALVIFTVLLGSCGGGGGGGGGQSGGGSSANGEGGLSAAEAVIAVLFSTGGGMAWIVAFFGWFACLALARMPRGFRDFQAYALRYGAQTYGYLLFLTDRYPDSDPVEPRTSAELPAQSVRIRIEDDLRRSRLTVLFRLLLAFPHFVWLLLWSIAAFIGSIANWFATLVLGRSPRPLHRFLAAYLRYSTHVSAYLFLVANPFPGFTGAAGRYPVDLEIEGPVAQRRWKTLLRILLALPALFIASGLGFLLFVVGFFGWFAALVTGAMPRGLRNAGAYALRYIAQTSAYASYILTDRYPYTGPAPTNEEPEDDGATDALEPVPGAA